jgi:hypothetical protein
MVDARCHLNKINGLFVIYNPAFCQRCERKYGRKTRIPSGRTLCSMCRSTVQQEASGKAWRTRKRVATARADAAQREEFETTLARMRANMRKINAEIKRKARAESADGT